MAQVVHTEVPSGEPRHTAMLTLTLTPLKDCFCGSDLHQVGLETAQLPGPIDQDTLIQQHLVDNEIVSRFGERRDGVMHPPEDRFTDRPVPNRDHARLARSVITKADRAEWAPQPASPTLRDHTEDIVDPKEQVGFGQSILEALCQGRFARV